MEAVAIRRRMRCNICIPWVLAVGVTILWMSTSPKTTECYTHHVSIGSRLADGCTHIYLDVGANIGMHERFLFESHLYPDVVRMENLYRRVFGAGTDRASVCAFGFEGSRKHDARLTQLEQCYSNVGYRAHFAKGRAVVGGNQTSVKFCYGNDERKEFWGAGIDNGKRKDPTRTVCESVPALNLAKFITTEILNRSVFPNTRPGKIMMKMDIEGAEYEVLPSLDKAGLLCQDGGIDLITIEFHTEERYKVQSNCGSRKATEIIEYDSEKYLSDGKSFPRAC